MECTLEKKFSFFPVKYFNALLYVRYHKQTTPSSRRIILKMEQDSMPFAYPVALGVHVLEPVQDSHDHDEADEQQCGPCML